MQGLSAGCAGICGGREDVVQAAAALGLEATTGRVDVEGGSLFCAFEAAVSRGVGMGLGEAGGEAGEAAGKTTGVRDMGPRRPGGCGLSEESESEGGEDDSTNPGRAEPTCVGSARNAHSRMHERRLRSGIYIY